MPEIDAYDLLRQQWAVLNHSGLGFTEIRIPKKGIQIFVDNEKDFIEKALAYCKADTYVGINPRKAAKDGDIQGVSYVTCIVFDFDPIRPKDTASTDEQHFEAIKLAEDFAGTIGGMLVSSGSGAHVYLPIQPIKVENAEAANEALRNFAKEIQSTYSTKTIKVDSTFDLPRIIRCWGSFNTKSQRPCELISGKIERRVFNLSDYATKAPVAVSSSGSAVAAGAIAPDLLSRWQKVSESSPKLKKMIAGTLTFASRSESDFAFAAALFEAGFNIEEVKVLILRNPKGKANERSDAQLDREVRRIYDRIAPNLPKNNAVLSPEEYMADLETRTPGIMTGFPRWDQMTAGLKGGRFYVTAGRPTDGKTTYLAQTIVNVASLGHRVMVFPTEVSKAHMYDKFISAKTGVTLRKFQFGNFTAEEKEKIVVAVREISKLPIIIVENFSPTLSDMVNAANNLSPDYLIADFLQNFKYNDPNSSSELSRNVLGLKEVGQKRNIPVNLASQLHRKPGDLEDSLQDLKGTGALEEVGDVVTFIRTKDTKPYPALSVERILKNKYGEPGSVNMQFYRSTCTFKEIEESI